MAANETRWLGAQETETWLALWTVTTWLPARLDSQLEEEAGLSLVEYHALSQISMAPQERMRLSDVAEAANMRLSHLSRVVSRLEKRGLLRREPDPADGRFTLGILTGEGRELVRRAAPGHVRAVREIVFDGLSEEEAADLGRAMVAIARRLPVPALARA